MRNQAPNATESDPIGAATPQPPAAYAVLVVARDGRCLYSPNLEGLVDAYPWEHCWEEAGRLALRDAFVEACMFRRRPPPLPASLRLGDRSFEFVAHLEPTGPEVVICRLVRVFDRSLTSRESDVLALVAGGATNGEIARLLDTKEGTVRSHLRNLRDKLGVARPEGLLLAAVGIEPSEITDAARP